MRLFLLISTVLLAAGCSPCSQSCREQANAFDRCLDTWGMGWADLGARDETAYREQCVDDSGRLLQSLSDEARSEEEKFCLDLAADLRAATTCDEAWEALVSYGAEP